MAQPQIEFAPDISHLITEDDGPEEFAPAPDTSHLITEDDEPVDNLFSETQQRLLTEPLYSSWAKPGQERTFLAAANIGIFYLARNPGIAPDVLLSLDVEIPEGFWSQERRSYFLWEHGKPPDLVIEIVSKTVRGEDTEKKDRYARMRVGYYIIFDPSGYLMTETLTVYRWNDFRYEAQASTQFPSLGLGLTLWEGEYEGKRDRWLRWVDDQGLLVPTGKERADQQSQRAERLAEMLRQLGENPDEI
ncbi:MAG: Uma2 family endonuclease [Acidobacteriota bacterium]|nr:Uma2 family endonuclease [Acidobacteriota bacterium]